MATAPPITSTAVKLVDLSRIHNELRPELIEAFEDVLDKGRFILGPQIAKLEEDFAQLQGCRHAAGVSSGTDALTLALKALDVGPGDQVIVPAMTFFATAEAVCILGATPVLVDVEPETLGLDPAQAAAAITDKTKAIIPVHLHGWPVPLDPFLQMTAERGLVLLEDCAQAHGASENGYPVGSRSHAGCFSFFPAKNLGALGDAGIVTTQSQELADRVRALANHGRSGKHANGEVGFNSRIDELQAALLNVKLPHLLDWNEQRRTLARRYNDLLASTHLVLPTSASDDRVPSYHLYVVRCRDAADRGRLAAELKSRQIETGIHYPTPVHLQEAFAFLGYANGQFPEAEQSARTMLSLPIFPGMTEDEQDRVVEGVLRFCD